MKKQTASKCDIKLSHVNHPSVTVRPDTTQQYYVSSYTRLSVSDGRVGES